jgi:hypothetical protein
MLVSLASECPGNNDEFFIYINESFFLNRFIGLYGNTNNL